MDMCQNRLQSNPKNTIALFLLFKTHTPCEGKCILFNHNFNMFQNNVLFCTLKRKPISSSNFRWFFRIVKLILVQIVREIAFRE